MKDIYLKIFCFFGFLFINEYAFSSSYTDSNNGYSFINLISFIFGFILIISAILFLSKILNFKLNSVGRKHRIKIIDVLNISGIKILILEIYDKYYVLAYNNNSITLIDELDNIELLEFNDSITNKSSFNKYLEKFFMKNDFKNKSKD